jgi:hypothetical protein
MYTGKFLVLSATSKDVTESTTELEIEFDLYLIESLMKLPLHFGACCK